MLKTNRPAGAPDLNPPPWQKQMLMSFSIEQQMIYPASYNFPIYNEFNFLVATSQIQYQVLQRAAILFLIVVYIRYVLARI